MLNKYSENMELNYLLQRYSDNRRSTLGLFFRRTESGLHFMGDTLEDEFREEKVPGETRVPAGKYEMKLRKVESNLTKKYRLRYPGWFVWHIELQDVLGFQYIYIHPGVNEDWTDGCILLSDKVPTADGLHALSGSANTWKQWYVECYDHLDQGGKAFIEIRDEVAIT